MMHRKGILALVALAALLVWVPPPDTRAQNGGWSTPIELSDVSAARTSWYPDLAVGPSGTVSVIWCSFPKTLDAQGRQISIDALMYRELRGGQWSPLNDIYSYSHSADDGVELTVRNSIAASPDGMLHVIFRRDRDIVHFEAPYEQAWSARGWSSYAPIAPEGGYYNALAVDQRGALHALWTGTVTDPPDRPRKICPNCANLFYRRSLDGGATWSLSQNLSQAFEGANRPQIKVDQIGRIHVVWDEGYDWYAGRGTPQYSVYRRSDDGGQTWTEPTVLSLTDSGTYQTTLALTAENSPMVVYRTAGFLYYQVSGDGGTSWSAPVEIPRILARSASDPNLDTYSMATDGSGRVHLLAVGFRADRVGERPALLHLVWDGTAWSEPAVIAENALFPEWPRLAIGEGNQLHAVWFTRTVLYGENDTKQVWYSGLRVDAAGVAPLPLFTPTPRPAPTAAPTATAVPTPLPPAVARVAPIEAPPAWESPAMVLVGAALLPVLLLLGLVIVVARRRM